MELSQIDITSSTKQLVEEIKAITNVKMAEDDLSEIEASWLKKRFKLFQLTYRDIVGILHKLLVTGGSSYGPADITTTSHWIPNGGAAGGRKNYMRVQTAGLPAIEIHQLSAFGFLGRKKLISVSVNREENEKASRNVVSHRCHVGQCMNPKHLVIETQQQNLARKKCVSSNSCTKEHSKKCLLGKEVDPQILWAMINAKQPQTTYEKRLQSVEKLRSLPIELREEKMRLIGNAEEIKRRYDRIEITASAVKQHSKELEQLSKKLQINEAKVLAHLNKT